MTKQRAIFDNFSAKIPVSTQLSELKIDAERGFYQTGNLWYNWGGLNEKWFLDTNGAWNFITPTGAIFLWDQNSETATGKKLGTVSQSSYENLTNLTAIHEKTLDQQYGFYSRSSSYSMNWGGLDEKWIQDSLDDWYFILPNGDLYLWNKGSKPPTGDLIAKVGTGSYKIPTRLIDADQSAKGFWSDGNLYENWGGRDEIWFLIADRSWVYVLSDGSVFYWEKGSNPPEGELVTVLDSMTLKTCREAALKVESGNVPVKVCQL
jgi:hypothetical protein